MYTPDHIEKKSLFVQVHNAQHFESSMEVHRLFANLQPPPPGHEAAVGSMEQNDCSTEVTTCIAIPECGRSSMRTSAKRGEISEPRNS